MSAKTPKSKIHLAKDSIYSCNLGDIEITSQPVITDLGVMYDCVLAFDVDDVPIFDGKLFDREGQLYFRELLGRWDEIQITIYHQHTPRNDRQVQSAGLAMITEGQLMLLENRFKNCLPQFLEILSEKSHGKVTELSHLNFKAASALIEKIEKYVTAANAMVPEQQAEKPADVPSEKLGFKSFDWFGGAECEPSNTPF